MVEFSTARINPAARRADCLVLGVYERREPTPSAQRADEAAGGALGQVLADGDLAAAVGSTALVRRPPGLPAKRVLLVRLGARSDLDDRAFRRAARSAARAVAGTGSISVADCLAEAEVGGGGEAGEEVRDEAWRVRTVAEAYGDAVYRFDEHKSEKDAASRPRLRRVAVHSPGGGPEARAAARRALAEAAAVDAGKRLARDLGNRPGNVCTPSHLAECAAALAEELEALSVEVLEEERMRELGMGALLAVARGSREPPKLIVVEYAGGNPDEAPVVLVGKGVTFDSGGISIKPAAAMDEMKFDMCGAASVLGAIRAAAELRLPLNVVSVVPTVENLPDGQACKPGDVVTSLSGQTIEILNTDAEGRLILCDAISYAERFDPDTVIDVATLTGACIIALGHVASGLFTNCPDLGGALRAAGARSGDRCWELPVWPEYEEALKSNFADVANVGGRPAGSVTAAVFLSRFARERRWAHLDVAGTAWTSGKSKGATGRPVPLLVQYLIDRAARQPA